MKQHVGRIAVAMCLLLLWIGGCDYFFDSQPEGLGTAPHTGVWSRTWAALYTPAVWLDHVLGAWLGQPGGGGDRVGLFLLCVAQVMPLLVLLVGGWPRVAMWREGLLVYAMIWVCLAVAGFIQMRGGITVYDS